MSPAKKKTPAADMAPPPPRPPGPGVEDPSLDEPTAPVAPPPPKASQQGPATVTPTGAPTGAPPEAMAQQGEYLTTAQGARLRTTDHALKAGRRGPVLLQDHHLREKITHFDHERIPERVVHARGTGAHGVFVANGRATKICRAAFLKKGVETPTFVRFSTVQGFRGSSDTVRDTRGFATKFYTSEGNYDLVGNNIPVFFIQEGIKFPDIVHAVKPEPDREIPQAQSAHDTFWDFVSLHTEAQAHVAWSMSDRAVPLSYRMMEGFGVHTFRLINDAGETSLVKFHWKPRQGVHSQVWEETQLTAGNDPDFHRRDLWDAINSGDLPAWDLGVQLFDEAFAEEFEFDVLDPTKFIPEEQVPVRIVGRLTLDRVVDNDFATTEQAAFHTGNLPPGIDFSNDPLLQGRNFSYLDTQLSRLGSTNFTHLPVNAPRCPVAHFQRDGAMQPTVPTGRANYEPNGWSGADRGPRADAASGFTSHREDVGGEKVRERSETFADHYSQARQFFISQTPVEQQHIIDGYTFELGKCQEASVRERMLGHLRNVHADLASGVADGLGMPLPKAAEAAIEPRDDLPASSALSILKNGPESFAGRKLGVLITPGTDAELFTTLRDAVTDARAVIAVVAPHAGPVELSDGAKVTPDEAIDGGPSVLFDAVALLPSADGAAQLAGRATARDFVADAFAHRKFIGVGPDAAALLEAAGVADKADGGFVEVAADTAPTFVTTLADLRFWERDVTP